MKAKPGSVQDAVRLMIALWGVFSTSTVLQVYTQEGEGCGHTVLSPKSGTIASRNYPGTYPNQTQCVWNLKVPAGFTLYLIFGDFDLEWSKDCRAGSLTITDKRKTINMGPLCGQLAASEKTVSVSSSEVTVRFVSGTHRSGRGFLLSYSTNQHPDLISCLHRGSHFTSQQISVFCPGGCKDVEGEIWGQHEQGYRDTSVLCKAAVHAGVFSDKEGGMINVTQQRGITLYESSFANGVLSKIGSLSDKRIVFNKACESSLAVMTYNASSMLEGVDGLGWTLEEGISRGHLVHWSTNIHDQQPWLEIELWNRNIITGIKTAGLPNFYIETYTLKFSKDRKTWKVYKNMFSKETQVFDASTDGHTVAFNSLFPSITARYLQIWPQRWHEKVSVQVQVLGCPSAVLRPRSSVDGSTALKPVPTETVLQNPSANKTTVAISSSQSSTQPLILVVGVILGAALCVWCMLAVLLWRRRKTAMRQNKCRVDTDCQGFHGKKMPFTDSELSNQIYPRARSIHDSLPSPPLNGESHCSIRDYAEPEVLTNGQIVGLTFRPQLNDGYTLPFSVSHYDTPIQIPEYAEPVLPEPEYATPFSDSGPEPFITTLDTRQNFSYNALQYDCPEHRGLTNGYCTPLISSSGTPRKPGDSPPQHTYHEPL